MESNHVGHLLRTLLPSHFMGLHIKMDLPQGTKKVYLIAGMSEDQMGICLTRNTG